MYLINNFYYIFLFEIVNALQFLCIFYTKIVVFNNLLYYLFYNYIYF